jgi:hypothetical protein
VAYLAHARKVEPPNQPFLSNTRTNNGTAGLRNARRCATCHGTPAWLDSTRNGENTASSTVA